MNRLAIGLSRDAAPCILALGAHCDDIEIGCGGTLLALRGAMPRAQIRWVVFSSDEVRRRELLESARRLFGNDPAIEIETEGFRDGYLPYEGRAVKDTFERIKQTCSPDLIFTHHRQDLHQDHRLVGELTWNTWRSHLILEYEIPKYDGDLGQPNAFFPLTTAQVDGKIEAILESYASQRQKQWFDGETLRGLLRLRGAECNAPERHAEAFYARKLVLGAS